MTKRQRPGRRSARAVEMRKVLHEQEQSGLGVAAFARQRGIPVSTLRWWRSMRRQGKAANGRRRGRPPGLVEVIGSGRVERAGAGFEVTLGSGRRVWVPMRFDVEALRALIRTLEGPC
ncbi:MAG: hypothetical protein JSU87_08955 [Gemmatimonadota bacterium]|nr:MAG: hypothetical protein JSU87_08955 [Gemmatimonadota bacterium]